MGQPARVTEYFEYRMWQIPWKRKDFFFEEENQRKHPGMFNMVRNSSFIGYGRKEGLEAVRTLHMLGIYSPICKVTAQNLEHAWTSTQSVENPYWHHYNVRMEKGFEEGAPSGSVGDIYERVKDGKLFVVASVGFVDFETGDRVDSM